MCLIFWRLNKTKFEISQAIFLPKRNLTSFENWKTFPSFLAGWVICHHSSESSRSFLYANGWCIIDPWIVFADRSPSVTLDQMSRLLDGKCYHWNGNMWIEGSFGSYRTIGSLETKWALLNGYFFPLLNSAEHYLAGIAVNEKMRSTKSIILIR